MGKGFAITALITGGVVVAGATGGSIVSSFESPCDGRTDGIDFYNGKLYHANYNGPNEILKTNTTGSLVGSFNEPAFAVGVDFNGSGFWVYAYRPQVPRHRLFELGKLGSILGSYAAPDHGEGVTYDGTYIWYSTGGSHYLNYVYKLTTTASVLGSFQAPHGQGYNNRGIDWGDGYLWLAQSGSTGGYFYQMTTSGSIVFSLYALGRRPTGVAWDGSHLWFVDGVSDWVFRMTWSGVAVEPTSFGRVKALFR